MLEIHLQQTTKADVIFRCFFAGVLRVYIYASTQFETHALTDTQCTVKRIIDGLGLKRLFF